MRKPKGDAHMRHVVLLVVLHATTLTPASAQQGCHASYEGACVPVARDVDCAGGSGNGPAYVRGPVYVVGPDVYDLDRDGNGVGCE
jgi:hypothetical protein